MPAKNFTFDYNFVSEAGVLDDLTSGIKNFIVNNFDTAHPIRSIFTEFVIPGTIMSISPIFGIVYELAGALGFVDWKAFWNSIIDPLEGLVSSTKTSVNKPTEEELGSKVQNIVGKSAQSFQDNSGDQPTPDQTNIIQSYYDKLKNLKVASNNETAMIVLALRQSIIKQASFKKTAGWASSIFRVLFRFLFSKIVWIAKKAVIGLAATTAAGAVATIAGNPKAQEGGEGIAGATGAKETNYTITNLIPISKTVSQDLYDYHANDASSIWIENGEIQDAPAKIMGWIMQAYPQLKKYQSDIENSSVFRTQISQIMSRNKLGRGSGFYVIPPPAERKIELVGNIVSNFVSEHLQELS